MYRTGDLARYLPDGNLAVPRPQRSPGEDPRLSHRAGRDRSAAARAIRRCARPSCSRASDRPATSGWSPMSYRGRCAAGALASALRAHLAALLPDYMVPAAFVRLERAAADRQRQARSQGPARAGCRRRWRPTAYEAHRKARSSRRSRRSGASCSGVERVSRHDNFFELGGHSLLAVHAHRAAAPRRPQRRGARPLATPMLAALAATRRRATQSVEVPREPHHAGLTAAHPGAAAAGRAHPGGDRPDHRRACRAVLATSRTSMPSPRCRKASCSITC